MVLMFDMGNTGCPKKKNIPIDPPTLQFLTYTFEISVEGRHFHSRFSAFYGFEKFWFWRA